MSPSCRWARDSRPASLLPRTLEEQGISVTVADARFCKPLDTELVEGLARNHPLLVTVEDGAIGGFATHVLQHLAARDLLGSTRFRAFTLPDRFVATARPPSNMPMRASTRRASPPAFWRRLAGASPAASAAGAPYRSAQQARPAPVQPVAEAHRHPPLESPHRRKIDGEDRQPHRHHPVTREPAGTR